MQHLLRTIRVSARWILLGDIAALLIAFIDSGIIARIINSHILKTSPHALLGIYTLKQSLVFLGIGVASILWLDTKGHYRHRLPYWETVSHILAIAFIGLLTGISGAFLSNKSFSHIWFGCSWLLFVVLVFTARNLIRRKLEASGKWQVPAIIIGNGVSAEAVLHALRREPDMGFSIVEQIAPEDIHTLTYPDAWKKLLIACEASHIFLALEATEFEQQHALKHLVRERVPCSIIPPWMALPTGTLSQHHFLMHDVLLLHDTNRLYLPVPCFLKRSVDILCSGLALLMLLPVFIPIIMLIKRDGGPAFFVQHRVGRNGKMFPCYKFRSMRMNAETLLEHYLASNPEAAAEWKKYQKLKKDVRITKIGRFIRKTSIDELPQLLNVLKGDMSLVGPRPIMPEQREFYGDDFTYYESVRPGITGPWQVSGRNRLTFSERVHLECNYARNWSLWMDIVILLKTLPALLNRDTVF